MTLSSMTGFATARGEGNGIRWQWEIKTVNGRGLDIRCRLAPGYESLEPEVRARVGRRIARGSCHMTLQVRGDQAETTLQLNEQALDQVLAAIDRLAGRIDAPPPRIENILAIKGVLEPREPDETEEVAAARTEDLLDGLERALAELDRSRRAEGGRLAAVIADQLQRIEDLVVEARDCPARTPDAIRSRLAEQVRRLMDTGAELSEERLHQEAALIATRADIQEELDRLFGHIEAARGLLEESAPVGRRLDFLSQELNREANTLCAKANDAALSAIGLNLKAVIDQMREQVQNVE